MPGLTDHCQTELATRDATMARRQLRTPDAALVSFASNDYLGLCHHPQVIAAAQEALVEGAGAGASRLVSGNHAYYAPLEAALATHKGKEAALVFGSGYLANLGTITALMGKGDLILADKLAHACILDGAQLSGATLKRFRHNDLAHAEALLSEHRAQYRHCLIVTEHIFSMDGDRAPLVELKTLSAQHASWLMVDDAHGLLDAPPIAADIWMGTLSKSLGAYGGYVAAAQPVIDLLTTSARPFIFSTGLPPSVCAAAHAALRIAVCEPERRERALAHAQRVRYALGLPVAHSTIVPLILGSSEAALAAAAALRDAGLEVVAIRPPTVPPNTARLRLTLTAGHTDTDIDRLLTVLKQEKLAA